MYPGGTYGGIKVYTSNTAPFSSSRDSCPVSDLYALKNNGPHSYRNFFPHVSVSWVTAIFGVRTICCKKPWLAALVLEERMGPFNYLTATETRSRSFGR